MNSFIRKSALRSSTFKLRATWRQDLCFRRFVRRPVVPGRNRTVKLVFRLLRAMQSPSSCLFSHTGHSRSVCQRQAAQSAIRFAATILPAGDKRLLCTCSHQRLKFYSLYQITPAIATPPFTPTLTRLLNHLSLNEYKICTTRTYFDNGWRSLPSVGITPVNNNNRDHGLCYG